MNLDILERMPPLGTEITETPYHILYEEAAEVLGYEAPRRRNEHFRLRMVLDLVQACPFTRESVERYKAMVAKEINSRFPLLHYLASVVFAVGMISFGLCFGPAILGWIISWKVGLSFAGGLIVSTIIVATLEGSTIIRGSWKVTPLSDYNKMVPDSALQHAVKIKKQCQQAEFFVHQFVQQKKVFDPFMAVRYGEEEYYFAVWEEPKFENQQVKDLLSVSSMSLT